MTLTLDDTHSKVIKYEACPHPKGKNFIDVYYGEKILFCENNKIEYYGSK